MAAGGPIHEQPITSKGGIDIAADAWLGFGVVVLAGVSIGAGAVVAPAPSSQKTSARAIAAGAPARHPDALVTFGETPEVTVRRLGLNTIAR